MKLSVQKILNRSVDLLELHAVKTLISNKLWTKPKYLFIKDEITTWLFDILNAIKEIDSFFSDSPKEFSTYLNDLRTRRAIERNIEIMWSIIIYHIPVLNTEVLTKPKSTYLNRIQGVFSSHRGCLKIRVSVSLKPKL